MLALVVTACLNSDPNACGDQVLGWLPYETESRCAIDSRQRVSAWARHNPDMTIKALTCMPGRHGVAPIPTYILAASHKLTD